MAEAPGGSVCTPTRRLSVAQIEQRYGSAATAVLIATGKQRAGSGGFSYHANGGGDGGGVSLVYVHNTVTDSPAPLVA